MNQIILLTISAIIGNCGTLDYHGNKNLRNIQSPLAPDYSQSPTSANEPYWPFARAKVATQARLYSRKNVDPLILQEQPNTYPIVINPEALQYEGSELQFNYRPTQIEYKFPESSHPVSPVRRPVITIGPQPQLPYGKPFIRVPYEENIPIAPIRKTPPVPSRDFGPFGNPGELADFSIDRIPPTRVYSPAITPQYAPTFTNYIPSLLFRHTMNPGTGEYNVEYDTANGIYQKESGFVKRVGIYNPITRRHEEKTANVKSGTVSWTSPEGIAFSFSYIADENGYRPTPLVQSVSPKTLPGTQGTQYPNVIIPYN